MKDMTIIANKKIVNKESGEVRQVVSIDEENRKIFSVPVNEPDAEPTVMAAATYDRRWTIYEEPEAPAPEDKPEPDGADDLLGDDEEAPAPEDKSADEPPAEEPKADKKAKKSAEADPADPMKMSETIAALEDIFDKLNAIYFEGKLPKPVITV